MGECSGPTWSVDEIPEVGCSPGREIESMIEPSMRRVISPGKKKERTCV